MRPGRKGAGAAGKAGGVENRSGKRGRIVGDKPERRNGMRRGNGIFAPERLELT